MNKDKDKSKREKVILTIKSLELLEPTEEGMELNEGYDYEVNGSMPQLADGIAKMAIEMDKQEDMGHLAGGAFITLILQFYNKLRDGE